ncbi:MAG: ABC transporter ATP-binding protein/permease [Paracoccaceae bacterium]|nr:ABC transporter ATP-binding protein/permease [Paracoccaceae bacterium]
MQKILTLFFQAKGTRPVIVLLCLLLGGLAEGLGLASLLPVLSIAIDGEGAAEGSSAALFTDALSSVGLPTTLGFLVAFFITGIVVKNLLILAAMTYVGYSVAHVATGLRRDLVDNLLNVRWGYFTQQPLGRITNSLSVDATRAGQAYLSAANFLVNAIQATVYAVVAMFVSWKVALVALAVGGAIAAFLSFLVRSAKRAGRRQTSYTSDFITYLSDALNNIKPLKAMARQESFARLIDKNIVGLRRALRRQVVAKQALKNLDEILNVVFLGIGLLAAIVYWKVPAAELAIIAILLIQLVNSIGRIQKEYQNAAIFESAYFNVQDQIAESGAERETDQGTALPSFETGCELVNVSFSHPRTPVLRDVSLEFPKGTITVLTGPSGAGKTTITDLVIGFLTPDSGQVLVDGRPLQDYALKPWRAMIGYVPQELVLFHDSIFANIALGNPEIGEDEVRAALQAAGALDFVEAMPEGMHTEVGEKGTKISGGQRQRIALARALVTNPKLLILDEVTSALDPDTERAIVENIRSLAHNATVIAITHRAAMLDIADQVFELIDGQVVATSKGQPVSSAV